MAANLQSDDGDLGFQVAPMVDVVFALMLFFLVSAAFQRREVDLGATISGPAHPGAPEVAINVTIANTSDVYLQDRFIAAADDRKVASLSEWLRASRKNFGGADPLVITPATSVKHERVMEVLNAVAVAEWQKVALR